MLKGLPNEDLCPREENVLKNPNIEMAVTICCEEGRHRSVAFVEELARELAVFKHGDSLSRHWQLNIEVTHRDIGNLNEPELSLNQKKRPNKVQAKSRQKERREKGNRHIANAGSHRFTDHYINSFVSGDNIGIGMSMFQGPQMLLFLVLVLSRRCILQIR